MDLKLSPEPAGAFEALAKLKDELDLNVELASPDRFLPPVQGWEHQSVFIGRYGQVDFFHYDFRAQALSKIARGYDRDLDDARAMIREGLVTKDTLNRAFLSIEPRLVRYPHVDAQSLRQRFERFMGSIDD